MLFDERATMVSLAFGQVLLGDGPWQAICFVKPARRRGLLRLTPVFLASHPATGHHGSCD
jgi:hypothetical protein